MFRKIALTLAFVAALVAPAVALDRVQWLYGLNPPSSWLNYQQRDVRYGFGQLVADLLGYGNTGSLWSNLSVAPVTGLYVAVQPNIGGTSNGVGSIYQWQNEELSPFGGPGATALPVDAHNIFVQGLLTAATPNIGPLTPPGTAGWSQIYYIECDVVTQDQTSQSVNFIAANGAVTPGTANRDRADTIGCQSKAGTAGVSPTPPTVDAGFVAIQQVTVPQGASTITSGMITAIAGDAAFGGFGQLAGNNTWLGSNSFSNVPFWTGAIPATQGGTGQTTLPLTTANGGTGGTSFTTSRCVRTSSATTMASANSDCPVMLNSSGTAVSGHMVVVQGDAVTITTGCASLANCTLTAGATIALTGSSIFASTNVPCFADATGGTYTYQWSAALATTSSIEINVRNTSGSASSVTSDNVNIVCGPAP